MKINLLGHCLLCLEKTENDKLSSSSSSSLNEPVSRMTFANKVIPQLLLEKSTEKENSIRDLFNQLHFCNSGGDEEGKGGEEEEDDEAPSSSPPPLCLSCLDQLKGLLKLLDELEVKSEELRSRISRGGDGGAFESLLRGSEVVEEETKETTLGFLECLREECCDATATTPPDAINEDEEDGQDQEAEDSNGGTEQDEEYQVLIVKDEEENGDEEDDVVEVPGPPPKNFQVVDISDGEDEEAMMEVEEDDDYSKVFEVEEFMVLPDDLIVDEVEGDPEDLQQDSSNDGNGHPQLSNVGGTGAGGGAPESDSTKMFPCTEPNCSKSYTHHRYLVRHMGVAHRPANGPPKPFTCEYCGKGYNYSYNLKYHIESQHLRTNYICEVCGKGFAGNSHLKKHYHRHLGHKPFHCPNRERGCEKSYTDRSNLNSHLKRCQLFLVEK